MAQLTPDLQVSPHASAEITTGMECLSRDEATELRNDLVTLHNLAGVEQSGDFQTSRDQDGSHFALPPESRLEPVSPFELDIALGTDRAGQELLIIKHAIPYLHMDGHTRYSFVFNFSPTRRTINMNFSKQEFGKGLDCVHPIFPIVPISDEPLDAGTVPNFKIMIGRVQEQRGKAPTPKRHSRLVAWLLEQ